jgi:drug/metabolite transporter (DMT)-like permease
MPEGAHPAQSAQNAAGPGSAAVTERAPKRRGGVLYGIACVMASYAMFALHDAGIKWLVADYSAWQILFVRSVVIFAVCMLVSRGRVARRAYCSPIRNALLLRAFGLLGAWLCFYNAAATLSLPQLMTIYFASPLVVAVLAAPILHEKVTRSRWFSILVGFAGVVIACRPGHLEHAGAIGLALLAAVLWAGSMILIRQIATRESTLVQMATSSFSFVVMAGIAMFWEWVTPSPVQFLLMVGIGLLGALAQFLLIEGIRRAPASVVSPLEFTALVWSFVLGYAIWGDIPYFNVFGGAVLILVSGALIVYEEWRTARIAVHSETAVG